VKRILLRSDAFIHDAKRLGKKDVRMLDALRVALRRLEDDAFQPQLKTHKLRGAMEGSWACSFGYDLRIIFELAQHEGKEAILLQSVGTHNEVY
jgi:mRNA-degrading endonuclease YafQ of YafQ-DinJ toxin-antitoxin module